MGLLGQFVADLRERNVLRVGALYLGIGLMLIEAGDILLPLFDVSPPVFRWLVAIVLLGFPVTLALSWFFELTTAGVLTDEAARARHAKPLLTGRKVDYTVIGILAFALVVSLTLNLQTLTSESGTEAPSEPVTVLIADFDNTTSEPLFSVMLEHALQIGIEGASFITSFPREDALKVAQEINPALIALDTEHARLVALRQGIELVLSGDASPDGSGFRISVSALEPTSGDIVLEASATAASKLEVLEAISQLSTDVREALGDVTVEDESFTAEPFTAASIEAVSAYMSAQEHAAGRRFEDAIRDYEQATQIDPKLGRAFSGWALASFELGHTVQARELWDRALKLLGTMSARERYRTLGHYYALSNQNYEKAVETYRELVERFPADGAGYNNLAVASFLRLDFAGAHAAGDEALKVYPNSLLYRSNYALYAMYASEFDAAANQSADILKSNPKFAMAYLPVAIAAIGRGNYDTATKAYESMAAAGDSGESLSITGLADLALYRGDLTEARHLLEMGVERDEQSGNKRAAATKMLMLADIHARNHSAEEARELIRRAFESGRRETQL
ncbi:MAG: tetratricopeptide repeat protein, partial [Gammaproteobacteria bacterium]|nr:tetratricopeptide repeat protein [Gammaproteobacteria bacterium]